MKEEIKMNSNTNSSKIIQQCLAESTKFVPTQGVINNDHPWPDPLPLPKIDLLPVKPFDCDILLPKALRSYVEDAAERAQVPPDLIAVPLVVSFSIILGKVYKIKPKQKDDWEVVANVWGMIIARSGSLKTYCLNTGIAPLKHLEARCREEFSSQLNASELERRQHEHIENALNDLLKKETKRIAESQIKGKFLEEIDQTNLKKIKDQMLQVSNQAPVKLTEKRFITNDPTVEKLHDLLSEPNSNGIMALRDELIGLLMGFEKTGHEQDRGFYLEGWNGNGSYQLDRIGRGSIYADNICLSVLGGTQPDKIQAYISQNTSPLKNDGLIQRFQLMIYPDQLPEFKYVDKYADSQAKEIIVKIAGIIEKSTFDIESIIFQLEPEAQSLFQNWYTKLKIRTKKERNSVIEEHLSKYANLIPSLALIFHVIELAQNESSITNIQPVSRSALEMAIEWESYLESHMRRIYNMGTNIAPRAAEILYKKIRDSKLKDGFTIRDVYRRDWQIIGDDRDIAQDACDELVKINVLREKHILGNFQQRTKVEYSINPKIFNKEESENHKVSVLSVPILAESEKINLCFDLEEEECIEGFEREVE